MITYTENEKENNIIIGLLIIAVLFTAIISISTSSKYTGELPEKQAEVPIARWEVFTNNDANKNINLIAGAQGQSYTIRVYSGSETAVDYSIEIHDVPSYITIDLDGVSKTPTNNEIVFDNVGTILTNDQTAHTHTLTISAALNAEEITNRDLDLDVVFVQVEA